MYNKYYYIYYTYIRIYSETVKFINLTVCEYIYDYIFNYLIPTLVKNKSVLLKEHHSM